MYEQIKLSYKPTIKSTDRIKVLSSHHAVNFLREHWDEDLEHIESFYILVLNRANCIVGHKLLSKGGVSGTVADIRVIFQVAILMNASGIIVSHNHPSGNTTPSNEDIKLTNKIKQAGELFDIKLLDHIILTDVNYYSFTDMGQL